MRIFVSYRRHDSQQTSYRIADQLRERYGRQSVFIDVDNLPAGVDFRLSIKSEIESCDVVLVIIGPSWTHNHEGSTIEDPADWVRIEVETALQAKVQTIPVLVDGAKMPDARSIPASIEQLAYLNAATIGEGRDFYHHVEWLIDSINRKSSRLALFQKSTPSRWSLAAAAIVALVLLNTGLFVYYRHSETPVVASAGGGAAPPPDPPVVPTVTPPAPAVEPPPTPTPAVLPVDPVPADPLPATPAAPEVPAPSPAQELCTVDGLDPNGNNWLALRVSPSHSASWSTTHMGPGTRLTILDTQGEWRHVRLQSGEEGWAGSRYIRCGDAPAPAAPAPASPSCSVDGLDPNGDNWLALRVSPSHSASWSTTHMGPGTPLTILDTQGEWRHVRLQSGEEGWASSRYIRCE